MTKLSYQSQLAAVLPKMLNTAAKDKPARIADNYEAQSMVRIISFHTKYCLNNVKQCVVVVLSPAPYCRHQGRRASDGYRSLFIRPGRRPLFDRRGRCFNACQSTSSHPFGARAKIRALMITVSDGSCALRRARPVNTFLLGHGKLLYG